MRVTDKSGIKGCVKATVFGPDGKVKLRKRSLWQKLFNLPAVPMISINHNLVTDEGDALVADIMQETPERTKLDNANGEISVGTGWVSTTKATDAIVTPEGSAEEMDATYPKTEGDWAAADDNVVQYRSTFEAGDLNASGIDEALLGNGTDTLAYAQITPSVNVTTADTLQVDWEITFLGA